MKIEICSDVIALLKKLYSESLPKETGGILFGHYTEDLETAIVTNIYYNISDSQQSYRSFKRGKKGFRKYSNEMWKKNTYYLGEWHTHPKSLPYMSSTDRNQMKAIKKSPKIKCPEPILIIVGERNNTLVAGKYIFYADTHLYEIVTI